MEFQEEIEFFNGIEIEEEKPTPTKGTSIIPFIQTLYAILQEKSNEQYIMWSPEDNGKSFFIKDAIIFSKEVLPRYYKHTNFCGFARQLALYGFKKHDDVYRYENEHFQKDHFELLKNIQRRKPQSQRKKHNSTSNMYHDLLAQLVALQKQNLDTIGQINTMKEMLFQLKLREETLEMKMQRVQDSLFNNSNYSMMNPFGSGESDVNFVNPLNQNNQNQNNANQNAQNNSNVTNNQNQQKNVMEQQLQKMIEENTPSRDNQRSQRNSSQNSQMPWKL